MLESRWVSSSKDIITFRKALLNPISSLQFRRFVSIKGDHYENDVLFWQEIQRYKVGIVCVHIYLVRFQLIRQRDISCGTFKMKAIYCRPCAYIQAHHQFNSDHLV